MKVTLTDMRDTRDVMEVDISEYLNPEVVKRFEEAGKKPVIKIRALTTKESDEIQGQLSQYASVDRRTQQSKFNNPIWLHESRIGMLERGVVKDDPDFPYEKWDRAFIEQLDQVCPALIRHLSEKLEELNRPLESESEPTSS
jgi:hypothetical protein